jgi:acyl dehydratase
MDVERAKDSIYGGLIASGWMIGALGFRLFLQLNVIGSHSQGSPGLQDVRWLKPVRPGDTIYMHAEVVEARPSRSDAGRGNVVMAWEIKNQRDEVVMAYQSVQLIMRRPADG